MASPTQTLADQTSSASGGPTNQPNEASYDVRQLRRERSRKPLNCSGKRIYFKDLEDDDFTIQRHSGYPERHRSRSPERSSKQKDVAHMYRERNEDNSVGEEIKELMDAGLEQSRIEFDTSVATKHQDTSQDRREEKRAEAKRLEELPEIKVSDDREKRALVELKEDLIKKASDSERSYAARKDELEQTYKRKHEEIYQDIKDNHDWFTRKEQRLREELKDELEYQIKRERRQHQHAMDTLQEQHKETVRKTEKELNEATIVASGRDLCQSVGI